MKFYTLLLLVQHVVLYRCSSDSGKNNRVLFLTNSEPGLSNVFLATSYALGVEHNMLELHFASFGRLEQPVARISEHVLNRLPQSRSITFHQLPGPGFMQTLHAQGHNIDNIIDAPGIGGQSAILPKLERYMMPWTAEEYVTLYWYISGLIEKIDPSVVVLDAMLSPALSAARFLNRKQVILSSNSLKDHFALTQKWGVGLWKYPALVPSLSRADGARLTDTV